MKPELRIPFAAATTILLFVLTCSFSYAGAPPTPRPTPTLLGIQETRFTLNGQPTFLLGISYYGALGASEVSMQQDLDDLQRHGFNWVRVWATWGAYGHDVSAVDRSGGPREPFLGRLQRLVAECDRRGLVVDVTLTRCEASSPRADGVGLPDFKAHQGAVETLIHALKPYQNWYLDLANERDVRDARYVSPAELKTLRELARRLDPQLLVTASFGGHDLSDGDIRDALLVAGCDFLSPHRPRSPESPAQTEAQTRSCLTLAKALGRVVPVHFQEPFRRGYGSWEPLAADFLADLRGAAAGGAAGWCLHNGSQRNAPDNEPRRSFDLSSRRLFEQLDTEELRVVAEAGRRNTLRPPPDEPTIGHLIHKAGTTHDELERLRLLRELEARRDLDATLREDLAKLLPVVDDWANGKSRPLVDMSRAAENGYLCRFITSRVRPATEGPVHPPELSADSPLRPIWAFYRGRMLIWQVIQSGPLLRVMERREKYYGEARRLLRETRQAFPDNRVTRMYLGEPIPWPKVYHPDPQAPAWANFQREGLEKLADVIHWWISERQLADGQFGGGWGDDVEMWRWWIPVLIAFDDPVVNAAQERLSEGVFRQPHMRQGFTSRVTDVEHSNEDTTDTILPMMHLRPEDPVWRGRALRLADLMRDRWTSRNERGQLQFQSVYFSVDKVDTDSNRAFDTVYHPSVIQPALLYWQRTGDPALTELFGEWLKVWVDATARSENGKPAGVLPSAIRWPDGGIAKPGLPWWEPFSAGHNDALYNWPGASRLMTSTLLLAYHMTQEQTYLEPIRSMMALRLKHQNATEGEPGSESWCAKKMAGFLADALAKLRMLTGDTQHDGLLRADASGYVRFRLSGDLAPLESGLLRNAEAFRSNWEAYTSEMRWTDRVISFTGNFLKYLPEPAPPSPSPEILYSTSTGDPGNPLVFPLNAVRWRTPPRDIAALVKDSSRTSFAAELFHFGTRSRDLSAEFFLLAPGDYELTLAVAGAHESRPIVRRTIRVEGSGVQASFQLPARRLCTLKLALQTP